jgi:PAS domain S-box-containing protein
MPKQVDPNAAGAAADPVTDGRHSIAALLPALGVTFWAVDSERRVTAIEGDGLSDLGASAADLIGRDPSDVFRLAGDHPFVAAFDRALRGETADLRTRWGGREFHVRIAPLRDDAGTLVGAAGFSIPIPDDLTVSPLALDESAEQMRRLVETSPIGIVHSHEDGRLLGANDSYLEMLGSTREDLEAGRILWNEITPEEYESLDRAAIREAIESGRSRPYEKEYRRRDGSRVPVLITVTRMPGRIHEGIASVLDLTLRKRVEQRLRAQVQAAAVLSNAGSADDIAVQLLPAVCTPLGWAGGALWLRTGDTLRCVSFWASPNREARAIADASFEIDHPRGSGLPGRVWDSGEIVWIDDLAAGPGSPRRELAHRAGFRCAVGIPIQSAAGLVGVIELVSRNAQPRDEELLQTLRSIASQLGIFLERRRAEAESRQLLQHLQVHVERMPLAYLMVDDAFRVAGWNPAAERIFGWRTEELLGTDAIETLVPPELRDEIRGVLGEIGARPESVAFRRNENLTRDGRRIVCDWSNTPLFDESGRFAGFVSMGQDVTAEVRLEESLRISEERYRSIVETTCEGVWTGDAAGRTTFANRRLAEMLGCTAAEMLDRSFVDFIAAPDREQRSRDFARILRGEARLEEIRLQRVDGGALWAQISAAPFVGHGQASGGALFMVTDVTERRSLEAQLLQSRKLEALGRLAGGVAHDFNNVLTVIAGYGELLGNRFGPEDPDRELVHEIQKAADHAAALTRQLLAFSRRVVVEFQIVDLNARITAGEDMLRRLLGEDIELLVDLAPGLGRVRVDPVQMDQILINLAANARDAMPRGGRLTIETANVTVRDGDTRTPDLRPGPYVRVTVRDTGVGIPPDVIDRVFEPFFTTKELGHGTGLGLATVYGIIQQFAGQIRALGEPGAGTSFEVYLPSIAAEAQDEHEQSATLRAIGNETVLLVEDDGAVRGFEKLALQAAGFRVLEADCGSEAIAVFEACGSDRGRIDVLVTDVVMPGMSGRELADALRERVPELPVLYLSGYTDDAVLRHGVLAAEASFLQKPFTAEALCSRLRAVLDAAQQRRAEGS